MKTPLVVHKHYHYYNTGDNREVIAAIADVKKEFLMAVVKFDEALAEVDAEITRIGALVVQLVGDLAAGGMTTEQETATLAKISDAGRRLKGIGSNPENPVPEPLPPQPTDPPVEPAPVDPAPVDPTEPESFSRNRR